MIVVLCEGNTLTRFDEGPMHGMHVTRPKAMHAGNIGPYFELYIFAISRQKVCCFLPILYTLPLFLPNLTKSRT